MGGKQKELCIYLYLAMLGIAIRWHMGLGNFPISKMTLVKNQVCPHVRLVFDPIYSFRAIRKAIASALICPLVKNLVVVLYQEQP